MQKHTSGKLIPLLIILLSLALGACGGGGGGASAPVEDTVINGNT